MRILSWDYVAISSMLLPGNWKQLVNEDAEVSKRAISIAKVGIIQEPVVRASDKRLIVGRRRVAAKAKLGDKEVLCKLIDCTDDEARLLETTENAEREHFSPDKQQANINILLDQLVAAEAGKTPLIPLGRPGRKKTVRTLAMEKVAKERGVRPETIRIQSWRHKKAVDLANGMFPGGNPPQKLPPAVTVPAPIEQFGMQVSPAFVSQVAQIQSAIEGASKAMSKASGLLTTISRSDLPLHDDRLGRVHSQIQEASAALRGLRPVMLCPYCKGLGRVTERCVPCNKTAYITKSQEANVPPELLRSENPLVLVEGKIVEAGDVIEELVTDPVVEEPPPADDFWL